MFTFLTTFNHMFNVYKWYVKWDIKIKQMNYTPLLLDRFVFGCGPWPLYWYRGTSRVIIRSMRHFRLICILKLGCFAFHAQLDIITCVSSMQMKRVCNLLYIINKRSFIINALSSVLFNFSLNLVIF